MESQFVSDVRKYAEDSFSSGLYCAESVLVALAKAQGVDSEILPRVATAFCSGMSRTYGTCGALTGAIMGVSLALGRSRQVTQYSLHTMPLNVLLKSLSKSSVLLIVTFC